MSFTIRAKLIGLFTLGGILSSGWFYVPALPETLSYYNSWSKMIHWQSVQYGLTSNFDRILFYLNNLINVHFTPIYSLALSIIIMIIVGYNLVKKKNEWASSIFDWLSYSPFATTIFVAISAILFLTLKGPLASVGDTPVLILLVASIIAFFNQLLPEIKKGLLLKIPIGIAMIIIFINSMTHLPFEIPKGGKDYYRFTQEIKEFRDSFGLSKVPFLQVFSHPVYNVDSAIWSWHINRAYPLANLVKSRTLDKIKILFPEDPEIIANKLKAIPFLILSDRNALEIGGEPFHTFNRFHQEINDALNRGGQYIRRKSIAVENGRFPMHFLINKNFSLFKPIDVTADGWVAWGSKIDFFALRPVKLRLKGIPIRQIDKIRLVPLDTGHTIDFSIIKVLSIILKLFLF